MPFTHRDGLTYLRILEALRKHINDVVENINDYRAAIGDEITSELNDAINDINNSFALTLGEVNDAIDEAKSELDSKITAAQEALDDQISGQQSLINQWLTSYNDMFQNLVETVVNSSIELQDEVAAAIIRNTETETRAALDSIYSTPVALTPGLRAMITDISGNPLVYTHSPEEITGQSLWSVTKVVNALTAMEFAPSSVLTDVVTITSGDVSRAVSTDSRISAGDQLSFLNLLYLSALESNNVAACAIARHVAENYLTPSGFDPYDAFVNAMNDYTASVLNCRGARCLTPHSRSMFSLNHMVHFSRQLQQHSVLQPIFAADNRLVQIVGPNARSFNITENIAKYDADWDEIGICKGGSVVNEGGAFSYRSGIYRFIMDGTPYYFVFIGMPYAAAERVQQTNLLLDIVRKGGRMFNDSPTPANNNAGRNVQYDTGWWDLTHIVSEDRRTSPDSHIRMRLYGRQVELSVRRIRFSDRQRVQFLPTPLVPAQFTVAAASPTHQLRYYHEDITDMLGLTRNPDVSRSGAYYDIAGNNHSINIFSCSGTVGQTLPYPSSHFNLTPATIGTGNDGGFCVVQDNGYFQWLHDTPGNYASAHVSWETRFNADTYAVVNGPSMQVFGSALNPNAGDGTYDVGDVSFTATWSVAMNARWPDANEMPGYSLTRF